MAKDGLITRKDLIEDQALNLGSDYAKNMQQAIEANKDFISSLKEMAPLVNAFRRVEGQQAYIELKNQENLATLKAINANKLLEASELSLEKIQKAKLITEKAELDVAAKKEAAVKRNTKLTAEERVQLEINNRALKQAAREQLGLVGAYEKLNIARTEAQKRLGDLLSAEKKNVTEIIIAQREFDKLDARVKAVDASIKNYSKNIGNYSSAFTGLKGTFKDLISTFGLVTGVALFGTIMKDIFGTVKDFDRQLIAVGKTTNITGEDLKQFGREVVELGDRLEGVSVDGLLKSAEVAGQLGVTGTANILKFSETIEKLKLTSNIISDEQVGQFAKFIEVSSDSFENADKLGSVITALGNAYATTEAEVLANSTEIQKGIAVYNTSAQGVLALGAATSTLGSEAESSRSAIQSTFSVINTAIATGANLQKVLKLTGLTQKELSDQFNKDATGVFQKFVKGLNTAKNEGQNLSLVLNDLGITEKRAFTVVGSLAANYNVLEGAMALASKEYKDNIALNKEVAAATQSISSILGDIKDKFNAYVLATNDANSGTETITKTLKFFRDNLKDIINYTIKYGAVILTFLGVQKAVNFVTVTYNALKVAGTAAQIAFTTSTGIGTAAMKAQALAAQEAAAAQGVLNTAVKATPWGLIIGLLLATTVAYAAFNDELSKQEKLLQEINKQNKYQQETESYYSKERDKNNEKDFKAIEDEIKLRRAKGENGQKLDEEEITRKKAIIQASLDVFNGLKQTEIERTKTEIQQSELRISQMAKERDAGSTIGKRRDQLIDLIDVEKDKLKITKSSLFTNSKITIEEQKRLQALLADLDKDKAVKDANFQKEEDSKAKAARLKSLKDRYDAEKKAQDDLFKLRQFRLQVAIDSNEEILKNEKASLDDRIDALTDYQKLVSTKTKQAAEYELQQLGKYNENTGKFVRQLSDKEIEILLNEGNIKKKLTSEQTLILEKFQNEQTKLKQKGIDERQKIIDNEVSLVQKQVDSNLQAQDTELNAALEAEKIKFKAITNGQNDIRDATEEHERQVLAIKELYAKKALQTQIDAFQKLLDAQNSLPKDEQISAEKRAKIEADLAKYRLQLSEIGITDFKAAAEKRVQLEQEAAETIRDLSTQLKDTLVDLTNTIFDARISKIDDDINKSNEYYNQQIELAGNDERQKSLLEKERAKKEDELQKKKQKEIVKAAIFNKVIATAEIGLNLAKTISAINLAAAELDAISFGIAGTPYRAIQIPLAIGLAAAQAAVVLATPIPKYKMGRKGGPAELAVTGDGGVPEVVSRPDGSGALVTPNKPTLTYLQKDDIVHKSVADYNEYMRRSILKGFYKERQQAHNYQVHFSGNSVDNTKELHEIKEAIKRQKTHVTVTNKIDIGYELWRASNINWRR